MEWNLGGVYYYAKYLLKKSLVNLMDHRLNIRKRQENYYDFYL